MFHTQPPYAVLDARQKIAAARDAYGLGDASVCRNRYIFHETVGIYNQCAGESLSEESDIHEGVLFKNI